MLGRDRESKGELVGYIGTLTDITELKSLERAHVKAPRLIEQQQRRRAEDAEKHQRSLEQFIDTMCHELRNPLNGIYGNVNLLKTSAAELESVIQAAAADDLKAGLRMKILDSIQSDKEALLAIEKCVQYQKVICDDVLSLSRLEAGKLELIPSDFKPNKLIKDIVGMLEAQARHKRLRFHLKLLPGGTWIKADANRLMQVLLNLVTNAIKFTLEEGEVTISLAQLKNAAGSDLLQVSVEDNGIGMTAEEQARVFNRFAQASRKTAAEYGGSGLGLAISKSLVTLMGGEITVKSAEGRGTQFTFTMKYETASPLREEQKATRRLSVSKLRKGLRILIVEDNVINQKLLNKQLTLAGYNCFIANNGQEAVDFFKKAPFDLIFMDIEMPVLNGKEATVAIRHYETEAKRARKTPIVGLSGNARAEHRAEALANGMNAYLVKPYDKTKLLETIAHYAPPDSPESGSSSSSPSQIDVDFNYPTSHEVDDARTAVSAGKILPSRYSEAKLSQTATQLISLATSGSRATEEAKTAITKPLETLAALIDYYRERGDTESVRQLTAVYDLQKTTRLENKEEKVEEKSEKDYAESDHALALQLQKEETASSGSSSGASSSRFPALAAPRSTPYVTPVVEAPPAPGSAILHFTGESGEKRDLRLYNQWYSDDGIQIIFRGATRPGVVRGALTYDQGDVDLDDATRPFSFAKQLQRFADYKDHFGASYGLFITKEPDRMDTSHYVVGAIIGQETLLLINPTGKKFHNLTEIYKAANAARIRNIYVCTTPIQREEKLVSCGPISVEFVHHFAELFRGKPSRFIVQELGKLPHSEDDEERYRKVDLWATPFMPSSLTNLIQCEEKSRYERHLVGIRASHLERLRTQPIAEDEAALMNLGQMDQLTAHHLEARSLEQASRLKAAIKPSSAKAATCSGSPIHTSDAPFHSTSSTPPVPDKDVLRLALS